MENRSFDSYFGKLNDYRVKNGLGRDVDGLPDDCSPSNSDWTVPCSAMNKSPDANGVPTTPVYAFHLKTACIENTSADWDVSHWAFNAEDPASDTPLMDGFAIGAASAALAIGGTPPPAGSPPGTPPHTAGVRAMGFYTADDLEYHYWLATQFATSDRWFAPAPAKTEPNRYYMVGATSAGHAHEAFDSIEGKTIFDLLGAAGVTWKIYFQTATPSAYEFAGFASRFASHVIHDDSNFSQFLADAKSGNLPQVAYLENPDADEHPGLGFSIDSGVALSQSLVGAVMTGPSWKDSVFILTFDEGGGLYDHVPPPTNVPSPDGIPPKDICTSATDPNCATAALSHATPPYDVPGDFTRYGFRVPLMVVSPYAKPGYVSHTVTDYTAWMKLVETRFNLPALTARDKAASDMTEFFDFQNPKWLTPPANPPAVKGGACYDGLP
ncbi:MAG: hypothetical protein JO041_16440 [Acidobacteria bacterium]|nr:hypothetical protein [Acidobacteriota bacterium]